VTGPSPRRSHGCWSRDRPGDHPDGHPGRECCGSGAGSPTRSATFGHSSASGRSTSPATRRNAAELGAGVQVGDVPVHDPGLQRAAPLDVGRRGARRRRRPGTPTTRRMSRRARPGCGCVPRWRWRRSTSALQPIGEAGQSLPESRAGSSPLVNDGAPGARLFEPL